MIHGVGTDLVSIERMAGALQRRGERFARRLLDDQEFVEFRASNNQPAFLAKRFAAKEAMAKALGTGLMREVGLHDLAVGHDSRGRPVPRLSIRGRNLLKTLAVACLHLSISDDAGNALAFAVAEAESSL